MIDINGGDHNELSNVGELRRRVFLSAVGGLSILGLTSSQSAAALIETSLDEEAYLENQTVVSENQEPTHVPVVPFPDLRSAVTRTNQPTPRTEDWVHSPYYQSLDGQWQFKWSLNPSIAPETLTDADTSDWDAIEVPSCWQTKGYGHPMYRNIPIEFPLYTPPNVPDVINPVGSYVRTFAVPDDWDGRETFLHFEGAKSAYFVWVNDEYVGYDQGAMTPAEFDVTNYLTSGENTVAVQVYRWSDGTYLENQDMWRFAGIYRSVYLYSTPRTHVRDYFARATLDDSYQDGTFEVDAEVAAYGALDTGEYTVRAHLFDNPGQEVIAEDATTSVETSVLPEAFSTDGTASVSLHANVSSPKKWSAEKPNLYVLALELQDPTGKTLEVQAEKVGFRTIEVSGGPENKQVLVNGKSVEFRGVNLHDHHPDSGRTVPLDTLQQDVERMKQFNVNAVRMSHYPHNVALYDLCNEYGLYVCDEVNAETHNDPTLSSTPSWEAAFVERFRRMIQRDKNFPSVLIWSTGNEAGLGDSHFAMAAYAEKIDPDRLLYHQSNFPDGKAPYADLVGPRYPTPAHVREVAENATEERPIVLGEYAHAMGNSLGNYTAYWDIVRSIGQVQGGFVWDWVDQALERPRTTTPDAANGIDGTIMGNPAVIDGPGGGRALAFSGLDDYVELPEDPALNVTKSALTLEAWVRPQNLNTPSPGYANVFTDDVEIVEKTATDPFLVT